MYGNKTKTDCFKIATFDVIMDIYKGKIELPEIFKDKADAILDSLESYEILVKVFKIEENGVENGD